MPSPNNGAGYRGFQDPNTAATSFGAQAFAISQLIRRISTATLVQVVGVTNDGDLSPVGFVDILPLVNQVDGSNNAVPHGTIYHCPYMRMQGGANAIILDPQVGDIGVAVFASHDVSSVTANKAQANPGSRRRFDMADGLYIGGMLNGVPTQYVQFSEEGITLHSPTMVKLDAPSVQIECQTLEVNATASVSIVTPAFNVTGVSTLTGPTTMIGQTTVIGTTVLDGPLSQGLGSGGGVASMLGPLVVTNDVTAEGKSVATHTHAQSGGGDTGPPI